MVVICCVLFVDFLFVVDLVMFVLFRFCSLWVLIVVCLVMLFCFDFGLIRLS